MVTNISHLTTIFSVGYGYVFSERKEESLVKLCPSVEITYICSLF